jgi:hypothetical protein
MSTNQERDFLNLLILLLCVVRISDLDELKISTEMKSKLLNYKLKSHKSI